MPRAVKFIVLPLLIVCFLALSFGAGFWVAGRDRPVLEAWQVLRQYYIDQAALDFRMLSQGLIEGIFDTDGAINSMLDSLNDPYTRYITAEEWEQEQSYFEGTLFIGIGVKLVKLSEDGEIKVQGVVPDSPADGAGIEPGDLILTVDGEPTSGMSLEEAALKIRGEEGTYVTLTVQRDGDGIPLLPIERKKIDISTWWQGLVDDDIAYIDIDYFSDQTDAKFFSILEDLEDIQDDGVAGIILDLRDNPGGVVESAVEVADQFLEEGVAILSIVYWDGSEQTFTAESGGLAEDPELKVAVLVNGNTASAAEMVAGALQDNERAPLIGLETYGKGCMQGVWELSNGSAVYITCAYWYTPSRYTDTYLTVGNGLIPNSEVAGEAEQLQQAINYIEAL